MKQSNVSRWIDPELILYATNLLEGLGPLLHVAYQAKLSGSKVLLVHVAPPSYLRANLDHGLPFILPSPELPAVRAKMDQMVREFERSGVCCESVILKGLPSEEIPILVKARGVDRVVVTTRDGGRLERLLEGSVADDLMASLDVPVCTVGPRARPGPSQ